MADGLRCPQCGFPWDEKNPDAYYPQRNDWYAGCIGQSYQYNDCDAHVTAKTKEEALKLWKERLV